MNKNVKMCFLHLWVNLYNGCYCCNLPSFLELIQVRLDLQQVNLCD